jgi:hypothetical protein
MTDFEKTVLADLATLKSEMRVLMGNGQPGRMDKLEKRVDAHERVVQGLAGIGGFLGAMLTAVHLAIDYFKLRH